MTDNLESKTLNGELYKKGYFAHLVIPNDKLPEKLALASVEIARGKFSDVKIIPSELAFKGYRWQLEKPSHIVYVKYAPNNPENPENNPGSIHILSGDFVYGDKQDYAVLPFGIIE